jgi:hypothetical protein
MASSTLARGAVVLWLLGCASGPPAGSERGACYGNGTCDAPLVCLSDLCVRDDSADAAAGVDAAIEPADAGMHGAVDADIPDGNQPDVQPSRDAGAPERWTYVVSALRVPTTAGEATSYGLDLDGDDTVDNQLGSFLGGLHSLAPDTFDYQPLSDDAVDRGAAIALIEVVATSLTDTDSALARMLQGSDPIPMACLDATDVLCRHHLTGTAAFVVVPPVPTSCAATIAAGSIDVGPAEMTIPVVLGSTAVWVPLAAARIRGMLSEPAISAGQLVGAIESSDFDAIVVPAMHAYYAEIVARDCSAGVCEAGSAGGSFLGLFDADGDGAITLDEVRRSDLIAALTPDLDLFDASGALGTDGVLDSISVGFGFEAVRGTFAAP